MHTKQKAFLNFWKKNSFPIRVVFLRILELVVKQRSKIQLFCLFVLCSRSLIEILKVPVQDCSVAQTKYSVESELLFKWQFTKHQIASNEGLMKLNKQLENPSAPYQIHNNLWSLCIWPPEKHNLRFVEKSSVNHVFAVSKVFEISLVWHLTHKWKSFYNKLLSTQTETLVVCNNL